MSLITEYFKYVEELKEKYGENTVVLIQVGKFYEIYSIKNNKENIGNAEEISKILNITLTKKNKNNPEVNRKNPYMAGIRVDTLIKYLSILLNNQYTVVTIDQINNNSDSLSIKRKITNVFSPGMNIDSLEFSIDNGNSNGNGITNYLMSIYVDVFSYNKYFIGVSVIDLRTGKLVIYEVTCDYIKGNGIDLVQSFVLIYPPCELIFYINISSHNLNLDKEKIKNNLLQNLGIDHVYIHDLSNSTEKYKSKDYQNIFLEQIFKNIQPSMLNIFEHLNIEYLEFATVSLTILLKYIYNHNEYIIKDIPIPTIYQSNKYLDLNNSSSIQLNIINSNNVNVNSKYKSIFNIINETKTSIGKRYLYNQLNHPIIDDILELNTRYNTISKFIEYPDKCIIIHDILKTIYDIEIFHRKLVIGVLDYTELYKLYINYKSIINLHELLLDWYNKEESCVIKNLLLSSNCLEILRDYIEDIESTFIIENLSNFTLFNINGNTCQIFKPNEIESLDICYKQLNKNIDRINEISKEYSNLINVDNDNIIKWQYSDKDGYYLVTTNTRAKVLKNKLTNSGNFIDINFITQSNYTKIITKELTILTKDIQTITEKINKQTIIEYKNLLQEYNKFYGSIFTDLVKFIECLDFYYSCSYVSFKYKFCKPLIGSCNLDKDSYIKATNVRHPIIERLNTKEKYIGNDIFLDKNGLILYSFNAGGKSSFLKSIGILIILAQMGMYVPATSLEYYPYSKIMTRIIGNDDIFKNQSSFVVEMTELRNILNYADNRTLVLADEITKGTETLSGSAIFVSSLMSLIDAKSSFIYTTHLHDITEIDEVVDLVKNNKIKICNLSIEIKNDEILYKRKIEDGQGSSLYGLEICKALNMNQKFINRAFNIRNKLTENQHTNLSIYKSRYNSKKMYVKCQICGYYPKKINELPLEIHHIEFQKHADENGYIGHMHKNEVYNLVSLCKKCHQQIDKTLFIYGYISSSSGVKLNYKLI
jgi:DNA mismatch repair protein MutS